jgi:hypothetical protein
MLFENIAAISSELIFLRLPECREKNKWLTL